MNINDIIYFSPNVKMEDLDFGDKQRLISAFRDRIENYYFKPITQLNGLRYAFGAGVIILSLIDAFARYSSENNNVGIRFTQWIINNINKTRIPMAIGVGDIARRVYTEFRCGLIHESHIKNGGQFCYETSQSIFVENDFIIINPLRLYDELRRYFTEFLKRLHEDEELYSIFLSRMKCDFEEECRMFSKTKESYRTDIG